MANTQSGISNLADLFKTFGPAFFGSGTTTSTSNPDPAALAASRGISAQAFANADNAESATNDIVNRIITKNAIAFGPVAAQSHVAGLYNDTVLRNLATEAQAQSTAEASKAVLDFRTNQLGIAQRATSDQLAASRTTTFRTAPQVSPNASILAGLGLGSISAYKNRKDILDFFGLNGKDAGQDKLLDPLTGKPIADTGSNALSTSQTQTNAAFGDAGASTTATSGPEELGTTLPDSENGALTSVNLGAMTEDQVGFAAPPQQETGGNVDTSSENAVDNTTDSTDPLTGESTPVSSAEEGTETGGAVINSADAAETGSAEAAGEAADTADLAGGLVESQGVGGVPIVSTAIGAGQYLSGDEFGGAETISSEGLGTFINAAIDNFSIICAELKRQGKLSDSLARRSLMHFRKYKEVSHEAYYIWARPSVKHLRNNPNSFYSKALSVIFNRRSEHLINKTVSTAGAYYLVSAVTVACWPILKLKQIKDWYLMERYLKQLYRSF